MLTVLASYEIPVSPRSELEFVRRTGRDTSSGLPFFSFKGHVFKQLQNQQLACPVCREPLQEEDWLLMPLKEAAPTALYIQPVARRAGADETPQA